MLAQRRISLEKARSEAQSILTLNPPTHGHELLNRLLPTATGSASRLLFGTGLLVMAFVTRKRFLATYGLDN